MAEEKTYVFGNDSQGLWSALPAMFKEAKKFMCDCCRQKLFKR